MAERVCYEEKRELSREHFIELIEVRAEDYEPWKESLEPRVISRMPSV